MTLSWLEDNVGGRVDVVRRLEAIEQVKPLAGDGVDGLAFEGGNESAEPGGILCQRNSGFAFINASLYW